MNAGKIMRALREAPNYNAGLGTSTLEDEAADLIESLQSQLAEKEKERQAWQDDFNALNEGGLKRIAKLESQLAEAERRARAVDELTAEVEQGQERDKRLMLEVCKLACESVEREKKLAKLEAEVEHAITATRWIPVAERLPDYDVPVLVTYLGFTDNKPYSDGIARWVLEMNGYTGGWEWTLDGGEVEVTITHWMPLPEPPEDKPCE